MKIIIINGSPRINGLTATILQQYQKQLSEKVGVEIIYYDLSKLTMDFCKGCCSCFRTGECYIKDDAEMLSQIISECDGIIIGTPTYASNISGLTKTFIDRGHIVIEQLLYQKHAISVVTYENYGGKDALSILNKLFTYSGAALSAKHIVKATFMKKGFLTSTIIKQINKNSDILYFNIKTRHNSLINSLKYKVIFNMGIRPFVKKKGEEYIGVQKRWEKLNIHV